MTIRLCTVLRYFLLCCLLVVSSSGNAPVAAAAGADYDGNGFSEIPVLTLDSRGKYVWTLFDPFSGKSTEFTSAFGGPSDALTLANWIYPKVTSAGIVSKPNAKSGGRLVWRIRTAVKNGQSKGKTVGSIGGARIQEQEKFLGRPSDILITGGDFTGDGVADAVVITNRGTGKHRWGLRGSFFLASYNPALHSNRAYFDFGTIGVDRPFFLNPDGERDWFAVVRDVKGGRQKITFTQPFTQQVRSLLVDSIPDANNLPVPLAQDDGSDLLVFHGRRGGQTDVAVKDLSGRDIAQVSLPIHGALTVGNYGPGPGEEIAVSSGGVFYIYNPLSGRLLHLKGPRGNSADSINVNTFR